MPKLGTHKHPAIVRVRTMAKAQEIMILCNEHGWQVIVGIEPDKPEDISDVQKLLSQSKEPAGQAGGGPLAGLKKVFSQAMAESDERTPIIGRNEPCPCGSGKKYKQCCLKKRARR